MLSAILAIATVICALGWINRLMVCCILLWYIQKKGLPFPTNDDLKEGGQWVAENITQDILNWGKRR